MEVAYDCTELKPRVTLVVVGHACVSHHFLVNQFPQTATKTAATQHRELVGGMGANAAIAAARLGAEVRFISCVGDDALADRIGTKLESEGVDSAGLMRQSGKETSISSVIVDATGERWVFNHRGSAMTESNATLDCETLAGADAVLVDPRWPAGALSALQWARSVGTVSVLDADVAPQPVLQSLVALSDWAAFSLGGLRCFAPGVIAPTGLGSPQALSQALSSARQTGARQALVTLGEWGVRTLNDQGNGLEVTRSISVHAIDTTGAGDVFHAALAVALAEGQPRTLALRFACVAAALKCAGGLGVEGAPTRVQVERALTDNPD